ncbi:MAG: hypothetical protein M1817_006403 [Caeruleum heppii]|nr:MAG: hypothetical protein M1817_006403 [Caeruleum heppii]
MLSTTISPLATLFALVPLLGFSAATPGTRCNADNLLRNLERNTATNFCSSYTICQAVPYPTHLTTTYPPARVSSACSCLNSVPSPTCAPQTITIPGEGEVTTVTIPTTVTLPGEEVTTTVTVEAQISSAP